PRRRELFARDDRPRDRGVFRRARRNGGVAAHVHLVGRGLLSAGRAGVDPRAEDGGSPGEPLATLHVSRPPRCRPPSLEATRDCAATLAWAATFVRSSGSRAKARAFFLLAAASRPEPSRASASGRLSFPHTAARTTPDSHRIP